MEISIRKTGWAYISLFLFLISFVIFIFGIGNSTASGCCTLIYAFMILWISNVISAAEDFKNKYIMLVLNLTYFLFYMGRVFFSYLLEGDYTLGSSYVGTFSDGVIHTTYIIIYCGLLFLRLFSFASVRNETENPVHESTVDLEVLNDIAYKLFWVTYPFAFLVILERVIFVSGTGYAQFYTDFSSSLPSVIVKLDGFNEILFFLFLGTMPEKDRAKKVMTAFLLLGVLSLGYGQRNPLAIKAVFILLIYIPLRNSLIGENEERWITRKYILLCAIGFPVLIVLCSVWVYVRAEASVSMSLSELILDFFDTEGNSAYLIALAVDNIDNFADNVIYTLSPIHDFITNNFIYKAIFGTSASVSGGRTYSAVMQSWSLGSPLSYFQSPTAYAAGVGTGTCYLAEAFVDFGYVGVALISFLYARIISYVQNFRRYNWLVFSIGLMSVYEILYAPRDLALSFVSQFFSFSFILMVVGIYFIYNRRVQQ